MTGLEPELLSGAISPKKLLSIYPIFRGLVYSVPMHLALITNLCFSIALAGGSSLANECEKDTDCKLIFSSCSCKAVPLESKETMNHTQICIRNSCDGLTGKVTAVCTDGSCTKKIEPKKTIK